MTPAPDFSRLTAAEREILALLAQGHTAKSIAAATGRSEGAVNERLRDARRKTGLGSSRELARLVRRQETRDEQIGVAADAAALPAPGRAPLPARRQGRTIVMAIITSGAAALVLTLLVPAQQQEATSTSGVRVDEETARVRATLAGEAHDPAWAPGAEAALCGRYRAIAGVDASALLVDCRTSWCAVTGGSATGTSAPRLRRAADELAGPALRESLSRAGLHADVTGNRSEGEGQAFRFSFAHYWARIPR